MTIVVTDTGFSPNTLTASPNDASVLDLASDTNPADIVGALDGIALVRINFPSFADGRGFTIAKQLRLNGYTGHLRAYGHVLADQYAMARRCGFDDVEIDDELAARQPEDQWLARAKWQQHDYQARMRGGSSAAA